ncbi:MAG: DUF6356 family protein [Pseudomonadota bacterium]
MHTEPQKAANIFTAHPQTVGESYWQHFCFAMRFAAMLAFAGFAAFIHAILPFCFETTAGRILRDLVAEMNARH